MAVLAGGGQAARLAFDTHADNKADRLLKLGSQYGDPGTWHSPDGPVLSLRRGFETLVLDVGVHVLVDGVTDGSNTLTSAAGRFEAAMAGLSLVIEGLGRRVIEAFVSPTEVLLSGPPLAAGTDRHFTLPTGVARFTDGVIGDPVTGVAGNTLASDSAPFSSRLIGRLIMILDAGAREVVDVVSESELVFDGDPLPAATSVWFSMPVTTVAADRLLRSPGGVVIESSRSPELSSPTVVRWRV
jgi:hypothetical protein